MKRRVVLTDANIKRLIVALSVYNDVLWPEGEDNPGKWVAAQIRENVRLRARLSSSDTGGRG